MLQVNNFIFIGASVSSTEIEKVMLQFLLYLKNKSAHAKLHKCLLLKAIK
jgi:hypothetical protein